MNNEENLLEALNKLLDIHPAEEWDCKMIERVGGYVYYTATDNKAGLSLVITKTSSDELYINRINGVFLYPALKEISKRFAVAIENFEKKKSEEARIREENKISALVDKINSVLNESN